VVRFSDLERSLGIATCPSSLARVKP